jgi:hypothetical protein
MTHVTRELRPGGRRAPGGWGLIAFAVGGLILVVIALIAIPLAGNRPAELAPASAPEGVVQRFFAATYRGDYTAAYAMLSAETQREVSLADFQARLRYERASEMRVDDVVIHDGTATVTVIVTHYSPGGLFGGSEWSSQTDLLLERDGDSWLIVGEPFW